LGREEGREGTVEAGHINEDNIHTAIKHKP